MADDLVRIVGGPLDGRPLPSVPDRMGFIHVRNNEHSGVEVREPGTPLAEGDGWHTVYVGCPTVGGPLVCEWVGKYPLRDEPG